MKKIKYNLLSFLLCIPLLYSCNDDFLQKEPKSDMVDSKYWNSEEDLAMFINTVYSDLIRGHEVGDSGTKLPPFGLTKSHLIFGDIGSDNMVKGGDPLTPLLLDRYSVPSGGTDTGWSWGVMRRINYFLTHYQKADIAQATKNRYVGEARFFKAWDYFNKLYCFGEVPWLTRNLETDSPELYEAKTPRVELVDSIMKSIDLAIEWLPDPYDSKIKNSKGPVGRLNRDMAYFLKARICLFEGTFRKYHTELNLPNADYYLQESAKACEYFLTGQAKGRYTLFNDGSDDTYWQLFKQKGDQIVTNPEIILGRQYDKSKNFTHATTRYWNFNSTWHGGQSATRSLVEEYLCEDGKPMPEDRKPGPNTLFQGYDGLWTELENRDPRLKQTIMKPGEYYSIWSDGTGGLRKGVWYPRIAASAAEQTGYRFNKYFMQEKVEHDSPGVLAGLEFRFAEILLTYAEAKAELGTITNEDIAITINKLRERAGFDFTKYPDARLTLSNIPTDSRLDNIYREKLGAALPPIIREIRRERRIEFAVEDQRHRDLVRWKAGKLLTVPLRGTKFDAAKAFIYNGEQNTEEIIATKIVIGKDAWVDSEGFLICYANKSNLLTDGTYIWDDKGYYAPIPLDQLILNKNLTQSPGWE